MINKSQYDFEDNRLGAANYKLTYKTKKTVEYIRFVCALVALW